MEIEVTMENRHLTWHMYRSLVGIAMICATIIVAVYILTGPIIKKNKAEALEKAILKVYIFLYILHILGIRWQRTC